MSETTGEVRQRAEDRLSQGGPAWAGRVIVDCLVAAGPNVVNLDWYLEQKINKSPESEYRNHGRVLRYTLNFVKHGAKVTFVQESDAARPDLLVEAKGPAFYVEIKKFGLQIQPSGHPVEKIVSAVSGKLRQLVPKAINFVVINNFDIRLESSEEEGLTHQHITDAVCEIERLVKENPAHYWSLSGIIFSAMSTGGAFTISDAGEVEIPEATILAAIPEFVWVNKASAPPVPQSLEDWIVAALPGGRRLQ